MRCNLIKIYFNRLLLRRMKITVPYSNIFLRYTRKTFHSIQHEGCAFIFCAKNSQPLSKNKPTVRTDPNTLSNTQFNEGVSRRPVIKSSVNSVDLLCFSFYFLRKDFFQRFAGVSWLVSFSRFVIANLPRKTSSAILK